MSFVVKEDFEEIFIDEYEDDGTLDLFDLKPVTKTIKKKFEMKRDYNRTSNEVRLKLIEDVHKKGQKIKFVSEK